MKEDTYNLINFFLIILFCTTRFWGINLPWYVNVVTRILIIVVLIYSNNLKISFSKEVKTIMTVTILPIVSILVYSLLVWLIGRHYPSAIVVRNLFSSSAYLIIDVFLGVFLYEKYGKKTVDIIVQCGFISYIIGSIIPLIFSYNLQGILYLITSHSNNDKLLYLTEVNDLTFAMGFCLLYYLFFDNRKNGIRKANIIKCILMIFWGLKRIEIGALLLCFVLFKFLFSKLSVKKSALISTMAVVLVSYLYVLFIHNGALVNLSEKLNINFMGRLKTYTYVANTFSSFKPNFFGIGFGNIDEILGVLEEKNYKMDGIPLISLHSDILRMYIGIGFIAFGLWIVYQCYIKTKILNDKVNSNCAKAYLLFTIYLFVIYLTDNTYSYPITFSMYIICTLCSINSWQKKIKSVQLVEMKEGGQHE